MLFLHEYAQYGRIVDIRMRGPIFPNGAKIYAAPRVIQVSDTVGPHDVATALRRAGYTAIGEKPVSQFGTYLVHENSIQIVPGPESFYGARGVKIHFANGAIEKISGIDSAQDFAAYELEPQLVTGLYEQSQRAKRRLLTYDEIPKTLRDAIISIEDRRFFEHNGVNYVRLAKAVFKDVETGQNMRGGGGSTLTMQFAKGYFLTNEKTLSRKMAQILIALQLERRFSKQQIFETYVNWAPMGQRGSFSIAGMGEAAEAYFGKDIKDLNLQECALLAGILQSPSYLGPFRHPDRALARRNLVLDAMVSTGSITREQAEKAKATPLKLAPPNIDADEAPYFVDMVRDSLQEEYKDEDLDNNGMRIYTSLNLDLQKAAAAAVDSNSKEIDELIRKLRTRKVKSGKGKGAKTETVVADGPQAQVALVAIDPHTGEVLALAGGRNYGMSQLNHALAMRPTGSIFKPFVYAAALNTAVATGADAGMGTQHAYTQTTMLNDTATSFQFGNITYRPRNFHNEYYGEVIARFALAHSLNNATVKLAEMVGYGQVANLAKSAGIDSVKATPSMALGSYDATPLEMAGAYTVFANGGMRVNPQMIDSVRNAQGDVLENFIASKKAVLDPRVAYVTTNMMEEVLNSGTAARVRTLGFTALAAGKTGTSHDGWFAGYTNNLLCIVWVGFDDYTDLGLQGADSAAPIWAAFMKKALTLPRYKDVKPFVAPQGVVSVKLDKATNLISTASCPNSYDAAFIEGTEPKETCDHTQATQPTKVLQVEGQTTKIAATVNTQ